MGGLAVLLLIGLYLVVAVMVVRAAPGQRAKIIATIIVILIPTADAILGRAYLAYLCGKDGGIKVYRKAEVLQGIRLDSFLATQGTDGALRQLLGLYGVSFIESPEKKDGSVDRIVLREGGIVRETAVSPRAKFRSRLLSSDHARVYLKNEHLIEVLVNGEIVAADIRYSFDGGWAEQFLASFTGAGPGGASRCDLPPLKRETLLKLVSSAATTEGKMK